MSTDKPIEGTTEEFRKILYIVTQYDIKEIGTILSFLAQLVIDDLSEKERHHFAELIAFTGARVPPGLDPSGDRRTNGVSSGRTSELPQEVAVAASEGDEIAYANASLRNQSEDERHD